MTAKHIPPIDDALFPAREELRAGFGWQGPVAVSLGSLVPSAGIDLLVQAAAMLRFAYPELRWVVMGDGPLLAPLTRLAAGLGVADRIAFAGHFPEAEVIRRLVAADLLMLPTRASRGLGPMLALAAACGLPVVANPVGAHGERIASLSPVRLAEDATPEALARATGSLLQALGEGDAGAMRRALRAAAGRGEPAHQDALAALQGIGD